MKHIPAAALKRLTKEYKKMQSEPPDLIIAKPTESNILEWHYVLTGPKDTPYEGGEYHGKVIFPSQYPFKPPSIKMITQNGRFIPNERICLSISDYHPESWNPSWYISTILVGLLSFMVENTHSAGCTQSTTEQKQMYAKASKAENRRNPVFREMFPELLEKSVENPRKKREIETIDLDEYSPPKKAKTIDLTADVIVSRKQYQVWIYNNRNRSGFTMHVGEYERWRWGVNEKFMILFVGAQLSTIFNPNLNIVCKLGLGAGSQTIVNACAGPNGTELLSLPVDQLAKQAFYNTATIQAFCSETCKSTLSTASKIANLVCGSTPLLVNSTITANGIPGLYQNLSAVTCVKQGDYCLPNIFKGLLDSGLEQNAAAAVIKFARNSSLACTPCVSSFVAAVKGNIESLTTVIGKDNGLVDALALTIDSTCNPKADPPAPNATRNFGVGIKLGILSAISIFLA